MLIDNFKIGTLEKWGFDAAWFDAHAPRLVRCSITGYGTTGPKAALPGYDFILQAESGLMSICGEPGGTPTKYGVAIVDVCTGMLGVQRDPGGAQRAPPHRPRPEGRAVALRDLARDARQRGGELPARRQGRRALRQRPSEHRAVYDVSGGGRDDRGRHRQRRAVHPLCGGARASRVAQGRSALPAIATAW